MSLCASLLAMILSILMGTGTAAAPTGAAAGTTTPPAQVSSTTTGSTSPSGSLAGSG